MPRFSPNPHNQRAIAIVLILFGLVVSAVGLATAGGSALHESGPAQSFGILIGLACFAAIAGIALSFRRRQGSARRFDQQSRTTRLYTAAGAILLVGAVLVPLAVIMIGRSPAGNAPPPLPPTSAPASTAVAPTFAPPPNALPRSTKTYNLHLTPILIVIGVLVAIVVALLIRRWLKLIDVRLGTGLITAEETPPEMEEERILADAMSAGRRALDGDDARAAIIACYAAMEESLAAVGIARGHADSPAELLSRAQAGGLLSGPGPDTLAVLFREARFSTHPMGTAQMNSARDALEQCTGQLRATEAAT